MEQHYIVVFGLNGESIGITYSAGVIIENYPNNPNKLLTLILEAIEDNSLKIFGRYFYSNQIAIKSLTRVF